MNKKGSLYANGEIYTKHQLKTIQKFEHNLVAVSTALYGSCDDFLSIVLLVFSIIAKVYVVFADDGEDENGMLLSRYVCSSIDELFRIMEEEYIKELQDQDK